METIDQASIFSQTVTLVEPLLYQRREYLEAIDVDAKTTSSVVTSNPKDYGPDD